MPVHPAILATQTHAFVKSQSWQAAVLPFGATEAHNLHMPYGTDTIQVTELAERACLRAWDKGARVALLPTMPFGVNTNHLKVPGGLVCSVTPTTLLALLSDLVESMSLQGVKKLVLLNGHGGNELKPLTRQLHHRTDVFLCVCDWWRMAGDIIAEVCERPGEHADEMETSLGLAYFNEMMRPELADEGAVRPTRFEAINKGWVSITRPWHLATTNTGIGDPRKATAEKGRAVMEATAARLGDFLAELARAEMTEAFPY